MRNLNYADSSFTLVHRRPAKQTVRNKIIKYKHNEFTQIRSSHTGNVHTDLIRAFANTVKWMRLTYTTYLDEVQKQPTDQILMVIVRMIFIKLGPLPIFTSSWLSTKTARASFKIAKKGPDLSHRNPPARNLNSESIGKLGALLIIKKNWRTAGEESKTYQEKLVKFKDNALCLVSQISIKGYLETIALEPNNGLLIHEGNLRNLNYADSSFTLVHRRPAKQTVRNKIIKYKHNEFTQIRSSHWECTHWLNKSFRKYGLVN